MRTHLFLLLAVGLLIAADAPKEEKKADTPKPAWTLKLDEMKVPDAPATGMVNGKAFTPDRAELQNGILTLRQGKDFFPDLDMQVALFLKPGESVEGKSYKVAPEQREIPHVHAHWKVPNEKLPKGASWSNGFAMILEFGKADGGKIPGQIYLCVPDESKSFLAGTFTVIVK